MRNIKLILEYDGTNYSGWQWQANALSIQEVVQKAVQKMTEEKISLMAASRTDAGVHALGQAAAFKTNRNIPCNGFLKGLNSLLPDDIRIVHCEEVPENFHPTIDAKRKTYRYLLETGEVPSALERNRVWWVGRKLNLEAMEEAAQYLIGEHDFKSFMGSDSDAKTTVRRLEEIRFERLAITFIGNGFLKHMVRNIVGTLVDVEIGKLKPTDVKEILEARDRTKAGICAPPRGLYLVGVEY